jgi:uncharacterized membrane protein YdbT with pleckstrin-like domain
MEQGDCDMSYVASVLIPGETIEYESRISWVGYIPGIVLLIIPPLGVVLLLLQWIRRVTTETAITNRRLIFKTGFVSRTAIDVERGRIETVALKQSVFGRILNYGTVTVHGTGIGEIVLSGMDEPVELRRRLSR